MFVERGLKATAEAETDNFNFDFNCNSCVRFRSFHAVNRTWLTPAQWLSLDSCSLSFFVDTRKKNRVIPPLVMAKRAQPKQKSPKPRPKPKQKRAPKSKAAPKAQGKKEEEEDVTALALVPSQPKAPTRKMTIYPPGMKMEEDPESATFLKCTFKWPRQVPQVPQEETLTEAVEDEINQIRMELATEAEASECEAEVGGENAAPPVPECEPAEGKVPEQSLKAEPEPEATKDVNPHEAMEPEQPTPQLQEGANMCEPTAAMQLEPGADMPEPKVAGVPGNVPDPETQMPVSQAQVADAGKGEAIKSMSEPGSKPEKLQESEATESKETRQPLKEVDTNAVPREPEAKEAPNQLETSKPVTTSAARTLEEATQQVLENDRPRSGTQSAKKQEPHTPMVKQQQFDSNRANKASTFGKQAMKKTVGDYTPSWYAHLNEEDTEKFRTHFRAQHQKMPFSDMRVVTGDLKTFWAWAQTEKDGDATVGIMAAMWHPMWERFVLLQHATHEDIPDGYFDSIETMLSDGDPEADFQNWQEFLRIKGADGLAAWLFNFQFQLSTL